MMAVAPSWIEAHCVIPDGFRKGRPFRLYEWQLLYIGNFYLVRGEALWDPENPVLATAFRYRRALLAGPQKVGKNPVIASHICVEGVGPSLFAGWAGTDDGWVCRDHGCRCGWEYPYQEGEPMGMVRPTALIQVTAFSEESTDNTYDALRPMIEEGPLSDVIPKTGEEFIRLPGGGRIDTVTSSAQSRLGQRVTFVPQDEVGIWTPQNKMDKVARTQWRGLAGMGGRAAMTTNAWDTAEQSVAQTEYESKSTDIYRQFTRPPKSLSFADKRERRKILQIVYPPDVRRENGGHVDLDAIEAEAAGMMEKDPTEAERFYGNVLVAGAGHAVDPDVWDALRKKRTLDARTLIGIGFDGSISEDATFLRGCTADGYSFLLGSWIRPVGEAMRAWQKEHPGHEWRVPRHEVHEAVARAFSTYSVGLMLCDPPKWISEIEGWALAYGEKRVLMFDTNVAARFAPAVDRWRTAIAEGSHTHDGDPDTDAHVKALHLKRVRLNSDDSDNRTRFVVTKGADRQKIDGGVADILALEAAKTMVAPEPEMAEPWALVYGEVA